MSTTTAVSHHDTTAQPSNDDPHPPEHGQPQTRRRPRAQPLTEWKSGHRGALMIRSWSDHLLVASGWASTLPLTAWQHRVPTAENGQPTPSLHPVILSQAAHKTAVARRSKNDTGEPRANRTIPRHLFGWWLVTSRLPLASGIYTGRALSAHGGSRSELDSRWTHADTSRRQPHHTQPLLSTEAANE